MIELGNKTYTVEQKRLREWLSLSEILTSLGEAVEHKDRESIADALCLYVSTALYLDKHGVTDLPWSEVANAFNEIYSANNLDLSHLAFTRADVKEDKKEAWDYPGRTWWTWAHNFAKEFGWDIPYIANLKVMDALSMLQEIFLDQYFTREWQWTLSEYSMKYNKDTKKSEPNPLPKPDWMKISSGKEAKPVDTIKIPKDMMPVGNIISHKTIKP